jgi:probable addiction module antidote protein
LIFTVPRLFGATRPPHYAAFDDGDTALISHALGVVARARGMSQIARDADMSRDAVYKTLSRDSNSTLSTLSKVMDAMGLQLTAKAVEHERVE